MIYTVAVSIKPYAKLTDEDKNNPKKFKKYNIDVKEELRYLGNIYDELVITKDEDYVIRRLLLNEFNILEVLDEPQKEKIKNADTSETNVNIKLFSGDNYIYILQNDVNVEEGTRFFSKYIIHNDFTDIYATEEETSSKIDQSAEKIELEVRKKVGEDEIISKINQSAEEIQIHADKINIDGKAVHFKTEVNRYVGTFKESDLDELKQLLMSDNYPTQEQITKFDVNQNNQLDSGDYIFIRDAIQYANGVLTQKGTYEISPTDPRKFISIYDNTLNSMDSSLKSQLQVALGLRNSKIDRLISSGIFLYENVDESSSEITKSYPTVRISYNGMDCVSDQQGNNILNLGYVNNEMELILKNLDSITKITSNEISTPSLTQTSLKENKKNFKKLDGALDKIRNIDIYKYHLKNEKDTDKEHIGFVIGDDYKYSTDVTNNENTGVDLYSFISLCCAAIQEQQKEIESLKGIVKEE